MGKCHFQEDWLKKKDVNNYVVKDWAKKHNDSEAYCTLCSKSFSITKGFDRFNQHASGEKHKKHCESTLARNQLKLGVSSTSASTQASENASKNPVNHKTPGAIYLYSAADQARKAELIWVMKSITADFSFSSSDGIGDTFRTMFTTENAVPQDFSLSRTKMSYLISDALGPYFRNAILDDIGSSHYSLLYDETTNAAHRKELQVMVKYWSNCKNMIVLHHLQTFFMGHATAEDLKQNIYTAITNAKLSFKRLLMLGSDGPNVNKKVEKLINLDILEVRKETLVDLGTCNIHILHNSFLKGLDQLGDNASNLITSVHNYFSSFPARWDDFELIQEEKGLPLHQFLRHVDSRWLTIQPAAERVVEQITGLEEYYFKFIPKHKPQLAKTLAYNNIVDLLRIPTIKAELQFVISSARIFTKFIGFFQRKEPLIHLLYSELKGLVEILILRICTKKSYQSQGLSVKVLEDEFLVPLKDIVISDEVKSELEKVPEKTRLLFLLAAREHYKIAAKEILVKSSLVSKRLIARFRCLQPKERTSERSKRDICEIAKCLPIDVSTDVLQDEWVLLQSENETISGNETRIDVYWAQFFDLRTDSGKLKYENVAKVVKAVLALSHGNADVERGFTASAHALTDSRASMKDRTLDSLQTCKSMLRTYDNLPHCVPITKELLDLARGAYAAYNLHLEDERKKAERETKKKKDDEEKKKAEAEALKKLSSEKKFLAEDENLLKVLKKEEKEQRRISDSTFKIAKERLKNATISRNFEEVGVAEALLLGATEARKKAEDKHKEVDRLQSSIDKRKSKLISTLEPMSKKRKTK